MGRFEHGFQKTIVLGHGCLDKNQIAFSHRLGGVKGDAIRAGFCLYSGDRTRLRKTVSFNATGEIRISRNSCRLDDITTPGLR